MKYKVQSFENLKNKCYNGYFNNEKEIIITSGVITVKPSLGVYYQFYKSNISSSPFSTELMEGEKLAYTYYSESIIKNIWQKLLQILKR